MCIGVPLCVEATEPGGDFAWCGDGARREHLDLRLIGPQPAGTWLLAFNGAARRVLDVEEAAQIRAALQALQAALDGRAEDIDALFADLTEREPQLPAHLQPPSARAVADAPPATPQETAA
jgi:hydrogenase expression/formation protein HypC